MKNNAAAEEWRRDAPLKRNLGALQRDKPSGDHPCRVLKNRKEGDGETSPDVFSTEPRGAAQWSSKGTVKRHVLFTRSGPSLTPATDFK
ncbi:hypothetical protein JOB18_048848 [Solea senegalensis]|uniref:Uncharacterized protein n=1 Tax=Solea senegalensis TaxID=28829 RepID=A0AAV6R1F2_SOLSE|nr:hypothetical protein JOB18_048848 [Solea senegalensis]